MSTAGPPYGYRTGEAEREAEVAARVAEAKRRALEGSTGTDVRVVATLPPLGEKRIPAPALAPEWARRVPEAAEPERCGRCGYTLPKCDCAARFMRLGQAPGTEATP